MSSLCVSTKSPSAAQQGSTKRGFHAENTVTLGHYQIIKVLKTRVNFRYSFEKNLHRMTTPLSLKIWPLPEADYSHSPLCVTFYILYKRFKIQNT